MVIQNDDLSKTMESFKKYTANEILKLLKKKNIKTLKKGYIDEPILGDIVVPEIMRGWTVLLKLRAFGS